MEKDNKAGRGLQDYAHLFLSRAANKSQPADKDKTAGPTPEEQKSGSSQPIETVPEKTPKRPYAIALCSPSRSLANAFLAMNLSLDINSRNFDVLVVNADLSFPSMILLSSLKTAGIRQPDGARREHSSRLEVITLDMDITIVHSPWADEQNPIIEEISESGRRADMIFINTSVGFSSNAKAIFKSADEIILCTDANLAHLIDTYSIVKMIQRITMSARISIIMTASDHEAIKGFRKINEAAQHFLGTTLTSYGYVPWDTDVVESIQKKSPVRPTCAAAHYIRTIGDQLFRSYSDWQKQYRTSEPSFIEKLFTVSGQAMSVGDPRYL